MKSCAGIFVAWLAILLCGVFTPALATEWNSKSIVDPVGGTNIRAASITNGLGFSVHLFMDADESVWWIVSMPETSRYGYRNDLDAVNISIDNETIQRRTSANNLFSADNRSIKWMVWDRVNNATEPSRLVQSILTGKRMVLRLQLESDARIETSFELESGRITIANALGLSTDDLEMIAKRRAVYDQEVAADRADADARRASAAPNPDFGPYTIVSQSDIARARAADLRRQIPGQAVVIEGEHYIVYADMDSLCGTPSNVDLRYIATDLPTVIADVKGRFIKSFHHATDIYLKCKKLDYDVYYFGRKIMRVRGNTHDLVADPSTWRDGELPASANFNTLMDRWNFRGEGVERYRIMVHALLLGSAQAGFDLGAIMGRDRELFGSYFQFSPDAPVNEVAKALTAFAFAVQRNFAETSKYVGVLPTEEMMLALDWVEAHPDGNPLTVTIQELQANRSQATSEALTTPTGGELLDVLSEYLIGSCSHKGMIAHARRQRGDAPIPRPTATLRANAGRCEMTEMGQSVSLAPRSLTREICTESDGGGYACRVSFMYSCHPIGPTCQIIESSLNTATIDVIPVQGAGSRWKAVSLMLDGEFRQNGSSGSGSPDPLENPGLQMMATEIWINGRP